MKGHFKCGNCRHLLTLPVEIVSDQHGQLMRDQDELKPSEADPECPDERYFIVESQMNQAVWISEQVEIGQWLKGKINCPYGCGAKLGSFNFVVAQKCACQKQLVSSIHLIKSRVDFHAL
jgi:E3 ubiquitin-protein ligase RNF180